MGQHHVDRFPGESDDYRAARDALLGAERALRQQIEAVAAQRRGLPLGGALKENYAFEEGAADLDDRDTVTRTRLSELFAPGKDNLVVYSFMYAPDGDPCPMCTTFLDSLNGTAQHIGDRVNLVVVAKAPIAVIRGWARGRGWHNLRLLSSGNTTYNTDYIAERDGTSQIPILNVFRKTGDGIFHAYATELLYAPAEGGQHNRHIDMMWPLWNFFDLTPEGRGTDWWPQLSYE